jgi:NAD(P)-dependent dehydrogenase (short-subunit alcohol dehydrogenase family)
MGKVILITGSETLLGRKLIEKNLSAGNKVIAPVHSKDENSNEPQKNNLLVVPWNKSSVISTRTVIREGIRVFRKIDEAILVYSENKTNDQLLDFSTSEIDEAIESSINGIVYLTREVIKALSGGENSAISFAMVRKIQSTDNPLEKGFKGFFKAFADTAILSSDSLYKCAFTTSVSEMDSYAGFISNLLNERPAKADRQWLNYTERKNLFSSLPILPRKQDLI